MSTIRFLRTFVAIARLGSFSEAAESVGLTQAAVSLQMRTLEEEFGRMLFDRSGRLALLNAAGQELLPEVKALLEHYDRIRQPRTAGQFVGQVTIGAIVSSMSVLAKIVSQLKKEHQELSIRLVSGKSSELTHKVARGELDAAFVVGTGRRYAGTRWTMLYQEPLNIMTHMSIRTRKPQDILTQHPFLRFDRSQHTGRQIDRVLQKMGIVPDDFLELNTIEQLLSLVRHQVGVTILPLLHTLHGDDLSDIRIVPLPASLGSPTRDVGMMERRDNPQQAITQALYEQYAATLLR